MGKFPKNRPVFKQESESNLWSRTNVEANLMVSKNVHSYEGCRSKN